jgi:hypothetical protein
MQNETGSNLFSNFFGTEGVLTGTYCPPLARTGTWEVSNKEIITKAGVICARARRHGARKGRVCKTGCIEDVAADNCRAGNMDAKASPGERAEPSVISVARQLGREPNSVCAAAIVPLLPLRLSREATLSHFPLLAAKIFTAPLTLRPSHKNKIFKKRSDLVRFGPVWSPCFQRLGMFFLSSLRMPMSAIATDFRYPLVASRAHSFERQVAVFGYSRPDLHHRARCKNGAIVVHVFRAPPPTEHLKHENFTQRTQPPVRRDTGAVAQLS